MEFYLAPMEGITGYIYRNALHDLFGDGIDAYYLPFIAPHTKRNYNSREMNDLLPEHNCGMHVVPQILTNSAEDFVKTAEDLCERYGYEELNLNLGCPSRTVVSKGRGAGFLAKPEELDRFFETVFQNTAVKVSVKTRLGLEDPEEFQELLKIFDRYPIERLIIHPRVGAEFYTGSPHREYFSFAEKNSCHSLCYNGDIFSKEDYTAVTGNFGDRVTAVMLGRGILANPALVRTIRTGKELTMEELKCFHDRLLRDYKEEMSGDRNVLFKMKELWTYMIRQFPGQEKTAKEIKKAGRLADYKAAVDRLFSSVG